MNQTSVCWPACGGVSPRALGCGEGSAGFLAGHQTKSPGRQALPTPELLDGFQVHVGGAVVTGYVINSGTVL